MRRKILKLFYPWVMAAGRWLGLKSGIAKNVHMVLPVQPIYDLHFTSNKNDEINFGVFKGKKVLLVNTASDCGYTHQLGELQRLQQLYKDLVVIGFPANDFKNQEKDGDQQIEHFCTVNYGVTFLLSKKTSVVSSAQQEDIYKWLTTSSSNGWNDQQPEWNFAKYLVDEKGVLTHYFGPGVSPLGTQVEQALTY